MMTLTHKNNHTILKITFLLNAYRGTELFDHLNLFHLNGSSFCETIKKKIYIIRRLNLPIPTKATISCVNVSRVILLLFKIKSYMYLKAQRYSFILWPTIGLKFEINLREL